MRDSYAFTESITRHSACTHEGFGIEANNKLNVLMILRLPKLKEPCTMPFNVI